MDVGDLRESAAFTRAISFQTSQSYLLAKVRTIFAYEGLPLTIPKRHLERYLTQKGFAVVYEHEGELFATDQAPAGNPDVYGDDRDITIRHGWAGGEVQLQRTVGVDAVLIRNDPDRVGLMPLLDEYCTLMAQAKLTMVKTLVNLRTPYIIVAKDENTRESAEDFERAISRGDTAVILSDELAGIGGADVVATAARSDTATDVVTLTQYINAFYYSELGLNLNNNMKSQYVSEAELEQSTGGALLTAMLEERQDAMRDIEALFGVTISVRLSDDWNNEKEADDAEPEGDSPTGEAGEAGAAGAAGAADDSEAEAEPEAEDRKSVV